MCVSAPQGDAAELCGSVVLQRDPRRLRSNPLCGEAQHGKAFAELLELLRPSQESVPEGWGSEEKESCVTKAVLL